MASSPNLISSVQTARRLALSRSSIYRLIDDDPSFPRPVKVGLKKIAFVETEVDAYIQTRIDARVGRSKQEAASDGLSIGISAGAS